MSTPSLEGANKQRPYGQSPITLVQATAAATKIGNFLPMLARNRVESMDAGL
ncbi:MAG: hypothetical protein ACRD18_10705 [Terriglobia bacterium]